MGKIIRNAYYNWLGFVVNFLLTIFITPFIIRSLGTQIYGIWALTLSLTGYFGILNFGMYHSVVKYVSEYNAKNNYEDMNHIINACFSFFFIIGMLIFVFSVPLALNFTRLFKAASSYPQAGLVVFLIMIQLAMEFPFRVFKSILSGMQRYDVTNIIFMAAAIIRSGLFIIFLRMGYGLLSLVIIGCVLNFISYVAIYIYVRRQYPHLRARLTKPPKNIIKLVFNYSIGVFILSLCTAVIDNSGLIIAAFFISAEAVAYFAIASRFILYLKSLIITAIEVLTPAISEFDANGQDEQIRNIFYYSTELLLLITLPIGIFAYFFGQSFFTLWLGEKFLISFHILLILLLPQVFALSLYGVQAIIYGTARLNFLARLMIIEAVLNLALSIIFAKVFGIVGIAYGISIPLFLLEVLLLPALYIHKFFKISPWKFIRKSLTLPFAALFILTGPLLLLRRYFYPSNWVGLIAQIVICSLLYVVTVMVLNPKDSEAKKIIKRLFFKFIQSKPEIV